MTSLTIEVKAPPDTLDDLFPPGSRFVSVVIGDGTRGVAMKARLVFGPGPEFKLLSAPPPEGAPLAGDAWTPICNTARTAAVVDGVMTDRRKKPDPQTPKAEHGPATADA